MVADHRRTSGDDKKYMNEFIPYGRQCIDEDDIQAVIAVLQSDWLTQGPHIEEFEKALANYCGAKYAVAVSSGTAALHLACLAAEIGPGDEVITSPITFAASANCALYVGAKPVFVDIDPDTICLDPDKLEEYLTDKDKTQKTVPVPKPKVVIPVHFGGHPCDMETIRKIADEHNLIVIEDACHALGSEWKDTRGRWQKAGSCSHSEMTVFSFHPVKHITTGEGGAILTNNSELYERLLLLRNHGITKNSDKFINKDMAYTYVDKLSSQSNLPLQINPWYYEMQMPGYNYRITDIQSALGLAQLGKVDGFIKRRREIVSEYNNMFSGIKGISIPEERPHARSSYHLYVLQVDFERIGKTRTQVMNELKEKGIGTQVHYIPVHFQPYYQKMYGYKQGDYPFAEAYYSRALSIPLYPSLKKHEIEKVIQSIISSISEEK